MLSPPSIFLILVYLRLSETKENIKLEICIHKFQYIIILFFVLNILILHLIFEHNACHQSKIAGNLLVELFGLLLPKVAIEVFPLEN